MDSVGGKKHGSEQVGRSRGGPTTPTRSSPQSIRKALPPLSHRAMDGAPSARTIALFSDRASQVEHFFARIKRCRRVATRYDKLAVTCLAMVIVFEHEKLEVYRIAVEYADAADAIASKLKRGNARRRGMPLRPPEHCSSGSSRC
jgi:hypothetical protein